MPQGLWSMSKEQYLEEVFRLDIYFKLSDILAGAVIRIRDAVKKKVENEKFLNYPTFVPKEGVEYAEELVLTAREDDPEEIYLHDNDVIDWAYIYTSIIFYYNWILIKTENS